MNEKDQKVIEWICRQAARGIIAELKDWAKERYGDDSPRIDRRGAHLLSYRMRSALKRFARKNIVSDWEIRIGTRDALLRRGLIKRIDYTACCITQLGREAAEKLLQDHTHDRAD